MPKVLMINPFFFPYLGGTEKHLIELCKRLAKKRGFEVTILTARLKNTRAEEEIEGIRVVRSPATVFYKLPRPLPPPLPVMLHHGKDLKRLARENDVVHGHNRFVYGLSETALVKKLGKKLCWTLHNARPSGIEPATDFLGQAYDNSIGRIVLNRCDGVLSVSKATMKVTLPRDYAGLAAVAYNGVDSKMFNPRRSGVDWSEKLAEFGLQEGERVVMTNCRLVKQKGVEYLIEAMRSVKNARLIVFGRGPMLDEWFKYSQKLGVKTIFYSQRLTDEALADLYAFCDVFMLPSVWEPFGIVLVEAMACGKPVVGTRVGGIPEIIEDGKNGFLVPPRNPKAIARKLNALFEDEKLARRLGAAGRKTAVKQFNWDNTARAYEAFYKKLL